MLKKIRIGLFLGMLGLFLSIPARAVPVCDAMKLMGALVAANECTISGGIGMSGLAVCEFRKTITDVHLTISTKAPLENSDIHLTIRGSGNDVGLRLVRNAANTAYVFRDPGLLACLDGNNRGFAEYYLGRINTIHQLPRCEQAYIDAAGAVRIDAGIAQQFINRCRLNHCDNEE